MVRAFNDRVLRHRLLVEVKILATTLAIGIAIDALVVRGLLAPALVGVMGRANWTLPRMWAKVLRVTP